MQKEIVRPNRVAIDPKSLDFAIDLLSKDDVLLWLKMCRATYYSEPVNLDDCSPALRIIFEGTKLNIINDIDENTRRVLRSRNNGKKHEKRARCRACDEPTATNGIPQHPTATYGNPQVIENLSQQTENAQDSILTDIISLQAREPLEDSLQDIFGKSDILSTETTQSSEMGGRGVISISISSSSSFLSNNINTSSRVCACEGACTCEAQDAEVVESKPRKPREKKRKQPTRINPPSRESVVEFVTSNGFSIKHGNEVYDYYTDGNWTDRNGDDIYNWKQKIRVNWLNEKHRKQDAQNAPTPREMLKEIVKQTNFKPS